MSKIVRLSVEVADEIKLLNMVMEQDFVIAEWHILHEPVEPHGLVARIYLEFGDHYWPRFSEFLRADTGIPWLEIKED